MTNAIRLIAVVLFVSAFSSSVSAESENISIVQAGEGSLHFDAASSEIEIGFEKLRVLHAKIDEKTSLVFYDDQELTQLGKRALQLLKGKNVVFMAKMGCNPDREIGPGCALTEIVLCLPTE